MSYEEVERLRQGLWDCAKESGADLDGQATPRALVSDIVAFAVGEVRQLRQDYEDDNHGGRGVSAGLFGLACTSIGRLEDRIARLESAMYALLDSVAHSPHYAVAQAYTALFANDEDTKGARG